MVPVFTVKNIQDLQPPYYSYSQIPGYFLGNYTPGMEQSGPNSFSGLPPRLFIVDKKTLHGAYYKLKIDELGGVNGWPNFSDGYFVMNSSAIALKENLQKLLDGGEVKDTATRKKMEELNNSINEEDNNITILARLTK